MRRTPRRPDRWPPEQRVRDDRLVFLAAEPQLRRMSNSIWTELQTFPKTAREQAVRRRMTAYTVAVDHLRLRLTEDELARVRASAELPEWFFPAVRREVRRSRRRRGKR